MAADPAGSTHDLMTYKAASTYTGLTSSTLRLYISTGRLPAYRFGPRAVRIRRADLEALLRRIPTNGDAA